MKYCKEAMSNETACGKNICCENCDTPCENKCNKTSETCGNLSEEAEMTFGNNEFAVANRDVLSKIREFELEIIKIEVQKKELREKLIKAMEEYGVKKFENDLISITYKEPYVKHSVDTKKLKNIMPDIAKQFETETQMPASIVIKAK